MDRVGTYELDELIGVGGSGSVWTDNRGGVLGEPVAIKRIEPGPDGSGIERARAEVSALDRLDHPHIVRIVDVVEDGSGFAIVMELAKGGSLHDLLFERELSAGEVVALCAPVADALASAHNAGLVHGDVRPANILLTADGEPLLADFGLAGDAIDDEGPAGDVRALAGVIVAALERRWGADTGDERSAGVRDVAYAAERTPPSASVLAAALRRSVPGAEMVLPGPARSRARAAPVTREYGPRPHRPTEQPDRRFRGMVMASSAVAMIICGLWMFTQTGHGEPLSVSVHTFSRTSRRCPVTTPLTAPTGATRLTADLDGLGCPVTLVWGSGLLLVPGAAGRSPRRYDFAPFVREPTAGGHSLRDGTLLAGDWNCDGADGVAYVEPGTTLIHYFDRLPVTGALRPAREERLGGTGGVTVEQVGGCDRVVRSR